MADEETKLPCEEKLVFDTEKEAEATALAVDWQRGLQLKTYKCQHCGLWHLSSK